MTAYGLNDYIEYRIKRARETISEVDVHIQNKFWNTAINRMYYACFYAVSALMAKKEISVSSHAGIRQKFGEHFVKTGLVERNLAKHYTELFDKRHKSDYNDFYEHDEQTVLRLFATSKEFIGRIEELL
jgi:uncharacterized protein (UPF0332 family)